MHNILYRYLDSTLYRTLAIGYVVFVLVVIIFSADIFGQYHSFTNKSDSMIPAIDQGSVTIVKNFQKYDIGDAIAYYSINEGQEEIVTHRVMDIGGNVYTTKGDANAVADRELVKPRLIIGKIIYTIPYLGYVLTFAKSAVGTWISIILPAVLIIISELIRIHLELVKSERKNEEIRTFS